MAILKVANTFFDGVGNSRIQVPTANTIQVFTNNTERLRIDPSGNLLIGRINSTVGGGVRVDVAGSVNAASYLVNGSAIDTPIGKQTIWIPATSMTSQITNGPAYGQLEMSTNRNIISYLAFDSTTSEGAQFGIQMPKSWNEGTLIGQFVWTHPTGTSAANSVVWSLRAVATANNDTLDVAFGSFVNSVANGATANSAYISPETAAFTVAGSPTPEEYITFRVERQPANTGDTMGVDAYLLGVKIHYTIDAAKDN